MNRLSLHDTYPLERRSCKSNKPGSYLQRNWLVENLLLNRSMSWRRLLHRLSCWKPVRSIWTCQWISRIKPLHFNDSRIRLLPMMNYLEPSSGSITSLLSSTNIVDIISLFPVGTALLNPWSSDDDSLLSFWTSLIYLTSFILNEFKQFLLRFAIGSSNATAYNQMVNSQCERYNDIWITVLLSLEKRELPLIT